jgi:hypothetical protein
MNEDFRAQITREEIQEAIAALEQGEVHAFGFTTFLMTAGDTLLKQSSALLCAACLAVHSVLMSFREARGPGHFDCSGTTASTS